MPCIMLNGFTAQAAAYPTSVAVVDGERRYSYQDLDRDSDRVAARLCESGVGRDVLVGVFTERSYATVVGIIAVIKSGGAYLPLDPGYPADRLRAMVADAQPRVLLTTTEMDTGQLNHSGSIVELDRELLGDSHPGSFAFAEREADDLAYVIYTSGSTGRPKGVAMPQQALDHLLQWQLDDSCSGGAGTATLQFAPLGFDVAFQEIFSTLCGGGRLVLVPERLRADGEGLLDLIEAEQINRIFLPFVALQLITDTAVRYTRYPRHLREVITAGEALQVNSTVRRFFSELPDCRLQNQYGPSETHVVTVHTLAGPAEHWPALPPIGKALPHVKTRIVDAELRDVKAGEQGEILLGGECLARGYLGKPEFTAERFITIEGERYYRTGDLGRDNPQAEIEFLGRSDDQVKLRGYRVELGEIEVALSNHPAIDQAVVSVHSDSRGDKRLMAYYKADGELSASELRTYLAASLPDYMLPARYVKVDTFLRTPSGKIDRRRLPAPTRSRPALANEYRQPANETESNIAAAWESLLDVSPVGRLDNFFDLGGNSLLALRFVEMLKKQYRLSLSPVELFEDPTLSSVARRLNSPSEKSEEAESSPARRVGHAGEAIAIIGMAARFPGADSVNEYWRNLLAGRESIRFFSREEVDAETPGGWKDDPHFVPARGLINRPARFDAAFFGISPREAEIIDPQQRLFLELAWAALEDSAYCPKSVQVPVGVFAGTANNSYFPNNIARRQDLIEKLGAFPIMTGNEKDYVASRAAHKLNLKGPAISVHTACSTSLVAVHQAVQALRAGECEMAIAGGAAVSAPQCEGYIHQEGGMLSADGHCRPFDAQASGTVFSDGGGAVVLKPLSTALADGDNVYAVIEGSAINNDGGDKASFSAPNPLGQKRVVLQAQRDAGIQAEAVGYVEAHGTATPLGDPIEIKALSDAFRENAGESAGKKDGGGDAAVECRIGSVKSNFGHLTGAAGVAGLIKAALAVKYGEIPPTLHYQSPNPAIDWSAIPFRVNAERERWTQAGARRAGVSSFGVGGTNAHVIVAQAPEATPSGPSRPWQVMVASHRSEAGLRRYEDAISAALQQPDIALADAAFSLNTSRLGFKHSSVVVANTADLASAAFQQRRAPFYRRAVRRDGRCDLAFLFPGQGAQAVGMGEALYQSEAVFQFSVDRSAEILQPLLGEDIREVIYPRLFGVPAQAEKLAQTLYTQLSLFVVEYALAELWLHWGARPTALFGHSIGEWVAACIAQCLSVEEALTAVYHRARLMQAQPAGAMLSVRASVEDLRRELPPDLDIAAINSEKAVVVAGPAENVERFAEFCRTRDLACRSLKTSHAFHSRMMDGALDAFRAELERLEFRAPSIPFISCVSGDWISEQEARAPDYWARQIRSPVQCAKAFATLSARANGLALELGPGNTLTRLCTQNGVKKSALEPIPTLESSGDRDGDWLVSLAAVGQVVTAGAHFEWKNFYASENRRRVSLPTYPFEGDDHWVYPHNHSQQPSAAAAAPTRTEDVMAVDPRIATGDESLPATLLAEVADTVQDLSGIELEEDANQTHLMELGLDSLLLTQLATALRRRFAVDISFRQLVEELTSMEAIAEFLWQNLDSERRGDYQAVVAAVSTTAESPAPADAQTASSQSAAPLQSVTSDAPGSLEQVINAQLQLMNQQLEMLRASRPQKPQETQSSTAPAAESRRPGAAREPQRPPSGQREQDEAPAQKKAFGAQTRINIENTTQLPAAVQSNLKKFVGQYVAKSPGSREFTQNSRAHLADPRAVSGFTPLLKEMVYPIVVKASDGARLWDVDGNEYIDLVNGFGSNFLGHGPDRIKQALHRQIESGWEIGPQSPLAADVAKLLCDLTGMERAALCNTGSEAVMGAVRLARTVTGRDKVVMFEGAYHGINDEVIVRAGRTRSLPAAAGIPVESVANVVVLEYGSESALRYIRENGEELAAVLVEPVQSRRPDLQPGRFLTALRAATQECGAALIFDEVITGFRIRPGGAQEYFGIRADLATYGKVIGGGMPIGAIAGSRTYMDALDGGYWRYGDESVPETGVTYFAGTFVRHPLALAAAKAALGFIREQGPQLQQMINETTQSLCDRINQYYRLLGFPFKLKNFGSLFKIAFEESQPLASLFFYKLRELGVHVWEGRPCFITVAHSDDDIDALENAFKEAADFMLQHCFILESTDTPEPMTRNGRSEKPTTENKVEVNADGPAEDKARGSVKEQNTSEGASPANRDEAAISPAYTIESTEAQREIWLAAQIDTGSNCAFNESLSLRLRGDLNRHALVAAIDRLRQRHDALRATFSADGRKMQVTENGQSDIELLDFSDLGTAEAEQKLAELRSTVAATPFDLQHGPLSRFQLLHLGADEHLLVVTCHHIVCDGWSIYLLCRELGELYAAELGQASSLPPAPSFADYAAWERSSEIAQKHRASLDYWRTQLADSAPFLELPTDKARPAVKTYGAQRIDYPIDAEIVRQARRLAAGQRTTLTAVLLSAYAAFAHRLTGREEVLLGLPFAGQLAKQDMQLVGHCVNLLPLKIRVNDEEGFEKLLARVKGQLLEAIDHQYLTFGTLLKSLSIQRDPSRPALLSTLFNVDVDAGEEWAYPKLDVGLTSNPRCFENFDLNLNISVAGDRACAECTFNTDLWLPETISRRLQELETLLSACIAEPGRALGTVPLMSSAEMAELMERCAGPAVNLRVSNLPDLLNLRKHGHRVAVSCGSPKNASAPENESLDYQQLEQRANRLANFLVAEGVERGDRVGILLDRSNRLPVSVLACWKAGAAFVPLDPSYPDERLSTMADSAQLAVVITESDLHERAAGLAERSLVLDRDSAGIEGQSDQPPKLSLAGDDLAYLIFTSGSTGKPKGVEVPHRAVVNFLLAMAERPGLRAEDKMLAVTTLSFDISVLELFLPLLVGAEVVIARREETLDGSKLQRLLSERDITIMQATPSTWRLLIAAGWKGGADFRVLCGGEAFPKDLAHQLYPLAAEVWNMYGPTEATVWASCYRLQEQDTRSSLPIAVGTPIANAQCFVLDRNRELLPAGVAGELFIGGDCLASGYWQLPELSAERFIDSPLASGGKLYRTGDMARWRADGYLECLGRLDDQVKLRGFRIELGELEARLASHADVLECVAAVKDYSDSDRRLVAYVRLSEGSELNNTEMRRYLRKSLPDYMIPQLFVSLESMPLTANGKIDRRKLPDPMQPVAGPAKPDRISCEVEQALGRIWSELLQVEPQTGEELFFDVGGHSLLALDLIAKVEEKLAVRITPLDVLLNNFSQLVAKVRAERGGEKAVAAEPALEDSDASAPSPSRRKPGFLGRLLGRQLH
ncbi:amino acid adenylation domain-containing protein [Proteobacteria bacterium 005FR1]|nr:amino acid adenylation domain-containing protein [Proteobacteria bacterium 005FR1]